MTTIEELVQDLINLRYEAEDVSNDAGIVAGRIEEISEEISRIRLELEDFTNQKPKLKLSVLVAALEQAGVEIDREG